MLKGKKKQLLSSFLILWLFFSFLFKSYTNNSFTQVINSALNKCFSKFIKASIAVVLEPKRTAFKNEVNVSYSCSSYCKSTYSLFFNSENREDGSRAALFPVQPQEENFLRILPTHNSYNRFLIFFFHLKIFIFWFEKNQSPCNHLRVSSQPVHMYEKMKSHDTIINLYEWRCSQTFVKSVCCSATIPLKHCVSFTELLTYLGSYSASRSKFIVCMITGISMSSFHPTLYLLPKIPSLMLIHILAFDSYCKISFHIFFLSWNSFH